MGFPFDEATWTGVDGAMYIGWGSSMPGIYTLIAALICAWVLIKGNASEHKRFEKFEK